MSSPHDARADRVTVTRTPPDAATMRHVGASIGRVLRPGELVLLFGELGAGKTTLVTGIAEGLGLDPRDVSSPTFVLCQEYSRDGSPTLVHVDAWRMRGPEDLESIGWDELRRDPTVVICLEWPERVIGAIGDPSRSERTLVVEIEHAERGRIVRIQVDPERAASLVNGSGMQTAGVRCRTCGAPIDPRGDEATFCSSRCRLADLHRWFSGQYRVEREATDEDFDAD